MAVKFFREDLLHQLKIDSGRVWWAIVFSMPVIEFKELN
jgi:hypothetical protein